MKLWTVTYSDGEVFTDLLVDVYVRPPSLQDIADSLNCLDHFESSTPMWVANEIQEYLDAGNAEKWHNHAHLKLKEVDRH